MNFGPPMIVRWRRSALPLLAMQSSAACNRGHRKARWWTGHKLMFGHVEMLF
jgi:hypothetical protein